MNKPVKYMPAEPTWNQIEAAVPFLSRPADTPDRQRRVIRELYKAMWEIAPTVKASPLTRRQKQVQLFLAEYQSQHKRSPSYDEIAAGIGVKTRQDVYAIIQALVRKKVLARTQKAGHRTLRLLVQPGDPVPIQTSKKK